MLRKMSIAGLVFFLVCGWARPRWGFFGHRHINRLAVYTLPPEMMVFYKPHIEWITEHAPDPDRRRYALVVEAPRHYMDLDVWGAPPFEVLTRDWLTDVMRHTDLKIFDGRDTLTLLKASEVDWTSAKIRVGRYFIPRERYEKFFKLHIFRKEEFDCHSLKWLRRDATFPCGELIVEDHLTPEGINPYYTEAMLKSLTTAFRQKDAGRILQLSADIGHYIADGHVPLHTTSNYNGQQTGQVGIHAFWESRIPELFADKEYDYFVGKPAYIEDKRQWIWDYVLESHRLVDSVLLLEKKVREEFADDEEMCFEQRNTLMVRTQCEAFAKAYQDAMNKMVERRFRSAIHDVASAWFTAWMDAGAPDLSDLAGQEIALPSDTLDKFYRKVPIKGRPHE